MRGDPHDSNDAGAQGSFNPYSPPVVEQFSTGENTGELRREIKYPSQTLTTFVCVLLGLNGLVDVVAIGSFYMQLDFLSQPQIDPEAADQNDMRVMAIGVVEFIVYLVTGICFCTWINRMHHNVRWFGAQGMSITPGWAVGYFFVPVMNLFRPYQAMQELWKASTSPGAWKQLAGSSIVGLWWTFWIITLVLERLVSSLGKRADTLNELKSITVLSIAESALAIPLCIIAINMIRVIQRAQKNWVDGANT